MKKSIIFTIITAILILTVCTPASVSAFTPDSKYTVNCDKYIVVSLETGNTVAAKNAGRKNAPAALVQLMTALVVYDRVTSLDETFYVSDEVIAAVMDTGAFGCDLKVGEQLSYRDQLYRMLLGSCADGACALASQVGGTIAGFVTMMNEKAAALGMSNTHFTDPTGLDDTGAYTTCEDMAKLAKVFIGNEVLYDMCCHTTKSIDATALTRTRNLASPNYFINQSYNAYYYTYAVGGKTGYTSSAGRCFFATASCDGMNYFVVLLGCASEDGEGKRVRYDFTSARQLFRWAFIELAYENVVDANLPLAEVDVSLALTTDHVSLIPEKNLYALVPSKDTDSVTYKAFVNSESVEAPVKKGDVLGYADVYCSGEYVGQINLVAQDDVDRFLLFFLWNRTVRFVTSKGFLVAAGIIFLLALAVLIVLRRARAKQRRERKRSSYRRR